MAKATNLSRPIIEALYTEALVLADDVRAVFARGAYEPELVNDRLANHGAGEEARGDATANNAMANNAMASNAMVRLALSTEGLKTTTRVMHILAWLLNQRAFFSGELNEEQVRKHGTLPADRPSDPKALEALEPATCELIAESEKLHERIARLDEAWRCGFEMASPARAFHSRLEQRFNAASF